MSLNYTLTDHYSYEDAPQAEDYVLTDVGPLLSRIGVDIIEGAHVGTFDDTESALQAIYARMRAEHFWPNIWYVSDHGNVSMVVTDSE